MTDATHPKPLPDTPEIRAAHSALLDALLPLMRFVPSERTMDELVAAQNGLVWAVVAHVRAFPSVPGGERTPDDGAMDTIVKQLERIAELNDKIFLLENDATGTADAIRSCLTLSPPNVVTALHTAREFHTRTIRRSAKR